MSNITHMKDETDKQMIEEVQAAYDNMKLRAMANLESHPNEERVHETDYVRVNGVKLTLTIYLRREPEGIVEQFEYYDYRYFHRKVFDTTNNPSYVYPNILMQMEKVVDKPTQFI